MSWVADKTESRRKLRGVPKPSRLSSGWVAGPAHKTRWHAPHPLPPPGKEVLEVGSGRGGGANFLATSKQPRQYTGLDFSPLNVELSQWCFRRDQTASGLL